MLFTGCKYFENVLSVLQVSADWERASLRPSSQPSSVFKSGPVIGTYTTEGGFINTNVVTTDEESQEFDDLIFALKTGEDHTYILQCSTDTFLFSISRSTKYYYSTPDSSNLY